MSVEEVVLLDEDGRAIGTTPKRTVHHHETPLHLAFSCYLFDDDGALLLTRRALHKPTWPGAWTNSFCGHPGPGEDLAEAVVRRAEQELGVELRSVELVLPAFRYQAEMPDGTRENEMCPVFVARSSAEVRPDPAEVDDSCWVPWRELVPEVLSGTREVSPWCVEQVRQLQSCQEGDWFTPADASQLPPAARLGRP
ncbi:MAG: isopentenyl-diphosphate Delta-isomerase [Nocardioidaceae bacterium]|nr:isopentenyl-diphosphate Delta-isomerase [Nocardioidaceae bacterium]